MGSQAQVASWFRDPGPVFGEVAPEVIEDTLIHLATENEQYLRKLSDRAGCFKETQVVEFIFLLSEKWHLDQSATYQAVELLERTQRLPASCKTITSDVYATTRLLLSYKRYHLQHFVEDCH